MKLLDFVVRDAVIADLKSTDRDSVIRELIDALVASGAASRAVRDDLVKMILARERNGSTGFGKGVAVPHVRHEKVKKIAAAIGVSHAGIDFNALDKGAVYCVFLLLSPHDKQEQHLEAMNNIFTHLQRDTFRRFLRQATTAAAVIELLQEADGQQSQG